jgi:hypothetical protein
MPFAFATQKSQGEMGKEGGTWLIGCESNCLSSCRKWASVKTKARVQILHFATELMVPQCLHASREVLMKCS